MRQSDTPDLGLVRDAMNTAYPQLLVIPKQTPSLDMDQELRRAHTSRKSLQVRHVSPTVTHEIWLDHTVLLPILSSSSPMSVPEDGPVQEHRDQSTAMTSPYNTNDLFEYTPQQHSRCRPSDSQSSICSESDRQNASLTCQNEHGADRTMSGALTANIAQTSNLARPTTQSVETEDIPARPQLVTGHKEPHSPTESELQEEGFEFHSHLPESIQLGRFGNYGLRTALKQVSPKLSRKEQWYAWRKAREMLEPSAAAMVRAASDNYSEQSEPDRTHRVVPGVAKQQEQDDDSDWIRTEVEPMMNDGHPVKSDTSNAVVVDRSGTSLREHGREQVQPLPQRVTDGQLIKTLIEQRHGSDRSQASAAMEFSPEDAPWLSDVAGYWPGLTPDCTDGSFSLWNVRTDDVRRSIYESSTCLKAWNAAVEDRTEYQKDHRGFLTRPVQYETLIFDHKPSNSNNRNELAHQFQIYDDNLGTATVPSHTIPDESSTIPTPGHMTPVNHSPLKRPDTPRPTDAIIQPSVEKAQASRFDMRDSTPAYEDRSPSPSPISQMNNSDTEMPDLPADLRARSAQTSPAPSFNHAPNAMLPPPSPYKSRSSSPVVRTFDPASPSLLRSPAIVRVLHESHSPHQQTQYPFPHRRRSPSPGPNYSPKSRHSYAVWDSLQQVNEDLASPSLGSELGSLTPLLSAPTQALKSSYFETGLTTLPTPPPIPDESEPKQLKLAKRGHSKSAVQDPNAKVGKARSVTASTSIGAAAAGAKSVGSTMIKGKRNVTTTAAKVKRQRAVTQGLAGADDAGGNLDKEPELGDKRPRRSQRIATRKSLNSSQEH